MHPLILCLICVVKLQIFQLHSFGSNLQITFASSCLRSYPPLFLIRKIVEFIFSSCQLWNFRTWNLRPPTHAFANFRFSSRLFAYHSIPNSPTVNLLRFMKTALADFHLQWISLNWAFSPPSPLPMIRKYAIGNGRQTPISIWQTGGEVLGNSTQYLYYSVFTSCPFRLGRPILAKRRNALIIELMLDSTLLLATAFATACPWHHHTSHTRSRKRLTALSRKRKSWPGIRYMKFSPGILSVFYEGLTSYRHISRESATKNTLNPYYSHWIRLFNRHFVLQKEHLSECKIDSNTPNRTILRQNCINTFTRRGVSIIKVFRGSRRLLACGPQPQRKHRIWKAHLP